METHLRAPLCSTGLDQHLSTFSNGQVAPGGKKAATVSKFSWPFCAWIQSSACLRARELYQNFTCAFMFHCLNDQASKSTVTVQLKLRGGNYGCTSGARPRQLPCPDWAWSWADAAALVHLEWTVPSWIPQEVAGSKLDLDAAARLFWRGLCLLDRDSWVLLQA